MLPIIPNEIIELVDMKNGKFTLDESADAEQKRIFEAFVKDVEEMECEAYGN